MQPNSYGDNRHAPNVYGEGKNQKRPDVNTLEKRPDVNTLEKRPEANTLEKDSPNLLNMTGDNLSGWFERSGKNTNLSSVYETNRIGLTQNNKQFFPVNKQQQMLALNKQQHMVGQYQEINPDYHHQIGGNQNQNMSNTKSDNDVNSLFSNK